MSTLLQILNLNFSYKTSGPLLTGINLSVDTGDKICLIGKNGSGKTTLFRCITGLEKIKDGKILLKDKFISNEKEFASLRRSVGYILQNSEDQLFFPKVLDDVSFGPINLGLSKIDAERRAMEVLKLLEIDHLAHSNSNYLSGGEQKLIAIASILAMKPELLLLDEPFNGLDKDKTELLLNILIKLNCSFILINHNTYLIENLNTINYKLKEGKLERVN